MITLIPGKVQNTYLNDVSNDRKKDNGFDYISGFSSFDQELIVKMNNLHETQNTRVQGDNRIDNLKQKRSGGNENKNVKNKKNVEDGKTNIVESSENKAIAKTQVKKIHENQKRTIKKLTREELKEIKLFTMNKKKNDNKAELDLNKRIAKGIEAEKKFIKLRGLNTGSKTVRSFLKTKKSVAKPNLKPLSKKMSIGLNRNTSGTSKLKPFSGSRRKLHTASKKIKLNLKKGKVEQKNTGVKINSDKIDSGQESQERNFSSIKGIDATPKGDAFMISKKYDFNIPEVAGKIDNFIHRSADEIFGEIVKHFTFVVNRGGGEAKLALYPPELGKIKMSIKLQNGKVSTFFLVDNQSVKDLIDAKLNVLQQNLIDQGFTLGSFNVGVRDESDNLNDFKDITKNLKNGSLNSINPAGELSGEAEDTVVQAVLPWLSSYINITV